MHEFLLMTLLANMTSLCWRLMDETEIKTVSE
jgi:hypothetical protein